MTWTKEREEKVRARLASAECKYASLKGGYVGRCNSSRCPKHGGAAQRHDLLSWLDAEREARQRAEAQVAAMKLRALGAHAAVWAAMQTDGSAADAVKDGGAVHEAIHSILAVETETISTPDEWRDHIARQDERIGALEADRAHAWGCVRTQTQRAYTLDDERRSLRAERDAIAARYDALRAAAERLCKDAAATRDVYYDADDLPDHLRTLDNSLVRCDAVIRHTAGAAREREARQAERERAIAVAVQSAAMAKSVEAGRSYRDVKALDLDAIIASVRGRT